MILNSILSFALTSAPTTAESLPVFLNQMKSRRHLVRFNNQEHRHEIYEKDLEKLVRVLGTHLKEDPKSFSKQFLSLDPKDKELISRDTEESNIEAFDVLSLELKNQIKDDLKELIRLKTFEDGAIWSFAKDRVRSLVGAARKRKVNALVLRLSGQEDQRGVFICDDDPLGIVHFELTKNAKKVFRCQNQNVIIEDQATVQIEKNLGNRNLSDFPSFAKDQELKVLFTIGKIPRIRQSFVDWLSMFLEYWQGYTVEKIEEVLLRSELEKSLIDSDVVFSVLDQPLRSDDWIFFPDSQTGWKLEFRKAKIAVKLLIPLTNDERKKVFVDSPGLTFSEAEFLRTLAQRKKPLLYFDITDYSANRLGRWLSIARQSPQDLFVVTSNQSHPFRRISDLFPPADLYLDVVADVAKGKPASIIRTRLENGPQFWGTLINVYRTLNTEANFDFGFSPVFQSDVLVQDFLKQKNLSSWLVRGPDGDYHLHPFPSLN